MGKKDQFPDENIKIAFITIILSRSKHQRLAEWMLELIKEKDMKAPKTGTELLDKIRREFGDPQ